MREVQRPVMCVRAHPKALPEGRKRRRIPSDRGAPVANWERPSILPYRVGDGWMSQPVLSANTHYRFRHPVIGSPYLDYVKQELFSWGRSLLAGHSRACSY